MKLSGGDAWSYVVAVVGDVVQVFVKRLGGKLRSRFIAGISLLNLLITCAELKERMADLNSIRKMEAQGIWRVTVSIRARCSSKSEQ